MISAYWQTKDGEASIWLKDVETNEHLGDLNVDEALRLRGMLDKMIRNCIDHNGRNIARQVEEHMERKRDIEEIEAKS